ncbi:PREDICTED: uncharacterized protein LOC104601030 [Nelumbo nucifera]|uniref:Uncharacterized protein LOC104601030 n=1 Tax=Nelumbo nucifera TaxID=4432 RepID=A0A1U8AJR6_NELNU|nr:PREDICTED: uncharacterized protein LOC104601030 [Nelumbo nucifera]
MRGDFANRNPNKYCHFHRDIGHDTESCRILKDEIKKLIHRDYLMQFVKRNERDSRPTNHSREAPELSRQQDRDQPPQDPPPIHRVINMITGGSILVGCNTTTGKNSVLELEQEDENPLKHPRVKEVIYFTEDDARGVQYPHDDALIVKMIINDFKVKRILVDSGSSTDILFLEAFKKMQLERKDLQPTDVPLVGFSRDVVKPLGRIKVLVTARSEHTFLVVATLSPYNAILVRSILHALRAMVSTYYISMKFSDEVWTRVIWGNQLESWKCYVAALKGKPKLAGDVELESPPSTQTSEPNP